MTQAESDSVSEAMLRTMQIIIGALVGGVVAFSAVALIVHGQQRLEPPADSMPQVSFVAVGFALAILAARALVVPAIAKSARNKLASQSDVTTKQLVERFMLRTIIGAALLEGSALFFLVTFMIEGQWWTLAGGLVMAVLLALLQFPTRLHVETAVAADRHAIPEARNRG
jgi:hypothetical protein